MIRVKYWLFNKIIQSRLHRRAATHEESISPIAECINRAHKETKGVTIVLENMAGAGNIIGGDFSYLASIISQVEDKTRIGPCLDTYMLYHLPLCSGSQTNLSFSLGHTFAAVSHFTTKGNQSLRV